MTDYASANLSLFLRAKEGDTLAREEIVKLNLGLVRSLAGRLCSGNMAEYDDLVGAGSIGLVKAIDHFECERGLSFSTYAFPIIAGEMKRFIRDNGPVKISRDIKEKSIKVRRAAQIFEKERGESPTPFMLADITGLPLDDVILALDAAAVPLSLDSADEEGDSFPAFTRVGQEDEAMSIDRLCLKEALSTLQKDDAAIIALRYYRGLTQREVADCLKITQVQVSRREKQILGKLKVLLAP